jgi:hypothetical protein
MSTASVFLRHAIDAAEFQSRLPLRFCRISMLARLLHLEMKLQFVLQVLFDLTTKN